MTVAREIYSSNRNQHISVQALLMVIESSNLEIKEVYVMVDQIIYLFLCFCSCFMYSICNIQKASAKVWQFIQHYFYDIKTKFDEIYITSKLLICYLEAQK